MITYSDLAAKVGLPKAQRAVGSAVGKNKVAYLIPCHWHSPNFVDTLHNAI
jgi:O-6-methylguanine DNA methyltransferase